MTKEPSTRLIHTPEAAARRTVNPPIERGSTVLFESEAALYGSKLGYGRRGLAVQKELSNALADLETAETAFLTPSGLTACAAAIASISQSGDHVLYCDSVYGPTRRFCERRLPKMGVTTAPFPTRLGAGVEALIKENTSAIILEAPGSLTFEIPDIYAIANIAKKHGVITVLDNTWSAGYFCKPLALNIDISLQALTKYVIGHADAFGGVITSRSTKLSGMIDACLEDWGLSLSPDDAYLALRGLRSLPVRLTQHQQTGLELANWLEAHPLVDTVIHPALPSHPDHVLWKRDFTGASGLFSFILKPVGKQKIDSMISRLNLFGMGFSWGGYESLIIPCDPQLKRPDGNWTENKAGALFRIHAGLEAVGDLIEDLEQAFLALQ